METNDRLSKSYDNFTPRPFTEVLITCLSMMPSDYDQQGFNIFQKCLYRSPEIAFQSWDDLSNLIFDYLSEVKGYTDLDKEYLVDSDRNLLRVLSNRVDYHEFLLIPQSHLFNEDANFYQLIQQNRQRLNNKLSQ